MISLKAFIAAYLNSERIITQKTDKCNRINNVSVILKGIRSYLMSARMCRVLWVSCNNSNSELTRYISFSYLMLLTSLAYYFYFISVVCKSLLTLEGKCMISIYIRKYNVKVWSCLCAFNLWTYCLYWKNWLQSWNNMKGLFFLASP